MNRKVLIIALPVIAVAAYLAFEGFTSGRGPHGGVVKNVGNYNIEMKTQEGALFTFLLNSEMKPVKNEGIICEAELTYPGQIHNTVYLKEYKEDGFFLESVSPFFTKCKIVYHGFGKTVSAEFTNEALTANETGAN